MAQANYARSLSARVLPGVLMIDRPCRLELLILLPYKDPSPVRSGLDQFQTIVIRLASGPLIFSQPFVDVLSVDWVIYTESEEWRPVTANQPAYGYRVDVQILRQFLERHHGVGRGVTSVHGARSASPGRESEYYTGTFPCISASVSFNLVPHRAPSWLRTQLGSLTSKHLPPLNDGLRPEPEASENEAGHTGLLLLWFPARPIRLKLPHAARLRWWSDTW